jgi:hypothetical protein
VPSASHDQVVLNCLFAKNGGYGIRDLAAFHHMALYDYNLFYQNTSGDWLTASYGGNNVTGSDPLFIDETADQEDLGVEAGSPAIGAGWPSSIGSLQGHPAMTTRTDIGLQSVPAAGGVSKLIGAGGGLIG